MTKPIFLFADSQLLFSKAADAPFLDSTRGADAAGAPRAAYIGASNRDAPEYYDLFEAAMRGVGVTACSMIRSAFSARDRAALREADIILLAGGDVERGWRVIARTGMKELIVERYRAGATLIGVSAGAVQLGSHGVRERARSGELFETFGLCPFLVIAHGEEQTWSAVAHAARVLDVPTQAIDVPFGGGVIYRADGSLEAMRRPAQEFLLERGVITRRSRLPPPPTDPASRSPSAPSAGAAGATGSCG